MSETNEQNLILNQNKDENKKFINFFNSFLTCD